MNIETIRTLIEQTQAGRAELFGENTILDGLKANNVDDNSVAQRVRSQARKADVKVLNKMKECCDAVIWLNPEIKASAETAAKIDKTLGKLESQDSWQAMWPVLKQAEAALIEQINLRNLLLKTVMESASSLASIDGQLPWNDTPSGALFGDELDLFSSPGPDQTAALLGSVNDKRTSAAQRGDSSVSDDEFAQILGVYDSSQNISHAS